MSSDSEKCPACGAPKSGWLDDNCPTCLMRLGAAAAQAVAAPISAASGPLTPALSPSEEAREALHGAQASLATIRYLGDYELLEEIARGGMGVVYRARQVSLNRMVAVKVLLGGQFANATFIQRFRREAEAAASLSHPNIVSIHEVGAHEGQPYFSMELIEGRSLAGLIRDQPPPARQAAQWLKTIAEAVHFAHERGVLHRDLKPSNVLVDELGAPHVTDFGLAKRLGVRQPSAAVDVAGGQAMGEEAEAPVDSEAAMKSARGLAHSKTSRTSDDELTLTGQVLGSPNYMPPEQADPKRGPTTAASDVYSLGAMLYHLLTGRPPFMAESVTQTLRLVAEGEPVSPRLLNPGLSRDLETICLKCLETDPPRRYASAQELADELGRFLRDEPIHARPISPIGRLARWYRRKPALAASLGVGAVLLLVVVIGSPIALVRIEHERATAETARRQETALRGRAESAERDTEQQLFSALLEQARVTVRSGELGQRVQALDAVRRAAAMSNTVELRREALAALALPDLRFERELPTGLDCTMAALDPKFERLALGHGTNAVEIRSVPDQRLLATLPASRNETAIAGRWSPDGRFLGVRRKLTASDALARVEIWDAASGRQVLLLPRTPYGVFSFHPTLPRVLGDSGSDSVSVWNLENGTMMARFPVTGLVHHLEFSPDGKSFLAQHRIERPWFTSLHDAASGAVRKTVLSGWIDGIAWHPRDRSIAFAARNGEVHLHDRTTDTTSVLGRHKNEARTAVFSSDGDFLFTGGEEQEIICWDLRTRQRAFNIGLRGMQMQFQADGPRCAVVTRTGVLLHSFEHSVPHRELTGDLGGSLRHGAFSPDGRWLAVGGLARLGVWDWTREAPAAMAVEAEHATPFFSPDGSELFAFWVENHARWRIKPGTGDTSPPDLAPLAAPNAKRVYSGHFVSDALVLGTGDGVLIVPGADIASKAGQLFEIGYTRGQVSANGLWLAARRTTTVQVYRLNQWEGARFLKFDSDLQAHAFAPDSSELAVASRTGVVFFDTNRWQPQRSLSAPLDRNTQLIFTPDGRAFWLARDARTAALHDTHTFETLLPLPSGMTPLALSPDGRHLAVSVDTRRVQVWDLAEVRERFRELGVDWADERSVTPQSKP